MKENIILLTDSYKKAHWKMPVAGITHLYDYGEPRIGGRYPYISWFGLRMPVQDHLLQVPTMPQIDYAEKRSFLTFGSHNYFNRKVWEAVRALGYLPIKIMAAPEGSRIAQGNVCFTIESTKDWFANSIGVIEDVLLHSWYPTAVATRSMYIKEALKPLFAKSSVAPEIAIQFAVNDFGLRGATCLQAAARGGAGHLVHFMGSDNEPAQSALYEYYGCEDRLKSVWATEHSIQLGFGPDGEKEYLKAQLERSDPEGIISVVIDGYDSDNFIQNVVADAEIKELIRQKPGRVVFRPDSGDPLTNILKYLDMLGGIFGYGINNKGYKVLNDNVGLIQGDGMNEDTIPALYADVMKAGWSADNFVTGSGGGLLQEGLTRDTNRWAIKPSYAIKNGQPYNMQKVPKTDMTKASKAGLLKLHPLQNGEFMTISSADLKEQFKGYIDALEPVLIDGVFYGEKFENILQRANKY